MTDALSDVEIVHRLRTIKAHGIEKARSQLGLRDRTIRETQVLARQRGLTADTKLVSAEDKWRLRALAAETELKHVSEANLKAEEIRAQIYDLSQFAPEPASWLTKAAHEPGTPGVPMLFLSDWHWGETVDPRQVGGVNAFNRAIAKARVAKLVQYSLDLMFSHMTNPQYPGIVILLGGDMITGGIHEELRDTNDGYVQESLLEVQDQLCGVIKTMAEHFQRVFIPCVVGNHGRETLKPRAKGRVYTSYEWNLYCQLERHFRDDERVQFLVPADVDAQFKVFQHRFLLTHGDSLGVKGGDGIIGVLGPITRGAFKLGRQKGVLGHDFDTLLMGHYHTYQPRGDATPVIVNGALKGYDEFAHLYLRAPYSRPSQALWFVHPRHGITATWPVYLDDHFRFDKKKVPQWLSWKG